MPVLTPPRRQAVHADDGQQHVVPDLRPLLGGQEVSRGSGEEVLGRLGVGGLRVADVDDGNAHRTPPSDNGETPVVSAFDRDEGDPPFRIEVQAPAVGLCELRIHARGFEKNVCPNSLRRAFNSPAEMPWRWV